MKTYIAGFTILFTILTGNLAVNAQQIEISNDSLQVVTPPIPKVIRSPKKASIYAALFPGLGQIYNRKYWKLPIVYGGYAGLIYVLGWNNNQYKDFFQGYRIIAAHTSTADMKLDERNFLDNLIKNPSISLDNPSIFTNISTQLKSGKDYYRRSRDLTIIGIAALHVLSIIDASVDANLFDFDISDDLSMRIEPMPVFLGDQNLIMGFNLAIKF
ncbi:MAG TPA: DUF5683 domain-containing protein [Prolixibacteraceae bacterium]|nr:DUF5683 domain-containing protein [Prolixibacteraceae bacterium]